MAKKRRVPRSRKFECTSARSQTWSALFSVQSVLLNLGARSQKLGAHSERTPSGYRAGTYPLCIHGACERRGEIQALPRAGSALSKVQSALRAVTEQIQSGYRSDTERRCVEEDSMRSHGLGARSQKFRAHSERIQSGYRADTDRIQMSDYGERRCVEEDSRRSHWLGVQSQKFRAHSERIQSGSERIQIGYR